MQAQPWGLWEQARVTFALSLPTPAFCQKSLMQSQKTSPQVPPLLLPPALSLQAEPKCPCSEGLGVREKLGGLRRHS